MISICKPYIICMNFLRNYRSVTVHSVHSNALRDAQKSCIRMISRRNSRVFCELCSQKTPRGTLPVNSNYQRAVKMQDSDSSCIL